MEASSRVKMSMILFTIIPKIFSLVFRIMTVPDLLALFSSASGSTEANDKLLLS